MLSQLLATSLPWILAWLTLVRDQDWIMAAASRKSCTANLAKLWSTKFINAISTMRCRCRVQSWQIEKVIRAHKALTQHSHQAWCSGRRWQGSKHNCGCTFLALGEISGIWVLTCIDQDDMFDDYDQHRLCIHTHRSKRNSAPSGTEVTGHRTRSAPQGFVPRLPGTSNLGTGDLLATWGLDRREPAKSTVKS